MKSISKKLIIAVLVIVVLTNALFLAISRSRSTYELTESIKNTMKRTVDYVASEIQAINEREFRMLESFGRMEIFINPSIDMHEKWISLNEIAKDNKDYIGMAIYNNQGTGWTTTEKWQDLSSREYLAQALKTQKPYVMKPNWSPVNGQVSTFYAMPYFYDGKMEGVFVSVLNGLNLSYAVRETVVGKSSRPCIVDMETGAYVAHYMLEEIQNQKTIRDDASPEFLKIIDKICAGDDDVCVYYDSILKQNMACVYKPVGGNCKWAAVITVPMDDFFGGLKSMVRILGVVFIFSSVLAAVFIGAIIISAMRPLRLLKKSINEISSGNADLTQRINVSSKDEVGDVVSGFNKFTGKLHSIVKDIKSSKDQLSGAGANLKSGTEQTASSISDILSNIHNVDSQIAKQSEDVNQTASAVNQISSNIMNLERMVESQAAEVHQASAAVEEMIKNIVGVDKTAFSLAQSYQTLLKDSDEGSKKQALVNERIVEIEEQSKMLQAANQVIASIASQTNLLAMNAAIEAAHAGQAGQGFAVVADEIRKLSETSSRQSKAIRDELGKIMKSIQNVVNASSVSKEAFDSVSQKIRETDSLVQQIKGAMDEQSEGSSQINQTLSAMNESSLEVKQAAKEMADGNGIILDAVKELQNSTLKIKDSMEQMAAGAEQIRGMGASLTEVSSSIESSIKQIGGQIDQFKV